MSTPLTPPNFAPHEPKRGTIAAIVKNGIDFSVVLTKKILWTSAVVPGIVVAKTTRRESYNEKHNQQPVRRQNLPGGNYSACNR